MRSDNKRRLLHRDSTPIVATDADFDAVFGASTPLPRSVPMDIAIDNIRPNPFQARTTFPNLNELAESMRIHGFTSRLLVRRDPVQPQFFQLVYGERRLRAAKAAGLTVLPCDVAEYDDVDLREIGLIENIQRQDLDPLEEARAFRTMLDENGYTIRSLAERIGKDKGYIQNRIKLLETPSDVQRMVEVRPDTVRVAREIAKLPSAAAREPLIAGVIAGEVNAQAVTNIVRDVTAEVDQDTGPVPVAQRVIAAVEARRTMPIPSQPDMLNQRQLEHDLDILQTSMARLYACVPALAEQQRALVLQRLEQHLTALEALLEVLR